MSDTFIKSMLDAHNIYRRKHQADALKHDKDLAKSAQKWAEHLAKKDKLEHDPDISKLGAGENVAMKYNSTHTNFTGQEFTDYWYSEVENYDFAKENQIQCGHFSQVVWRASESCGFGRAVSKSGKVYVVGRYKPAGNYSDEFKINVLPPKDGKIVLPQNPEKPSGGASGNTTKPIIGPKNSEDHLLETKKNVVKEGNKTTEKIEETYKTPTGKKYTRTKEKIFYD